MWTGELYPKIINFGFIPDFGGTPYMWPSPITRLSLAQNKDNMGGLHCLVLTRPPIEYYLKEWISQDWAGGLGPDSRVNTITLSELSAPIAPMTQKGR
jgi:hypothetical protein